MTRKYNVQRRCAKYGCDKKVDPNSNLTKTYCPEHSPTNCYKKVKK